jgi:hypothetical protein
MLRLRPRRETVRVRSEKGERRFVIFAIFCKIEMDTTNQIPGRVYTGMVDRLPLFGELRD